MGVLTRLGLAVKALTVTKLPSGTSSWWQLPRTNYDYETAAGDGRQSSIIMACLAWLQKTYPEAPATLKRRLPDGAWDEIVDHPLLGLLESPNPYYDGHLLNAAMLADLKLTGNAYWLKLKSGAGRTVALYWVPASMLEPKWTVNSDEYISHYAYTPGSQTIRLEVNDVVHFREGLDPKNIRKGLSPLASLFREVFTDHEAGNMTAALLKNMGVPGLLIAPKADSGAQPQDLQLVKDYLREKFVGDYRGEPLALAAPTEVQQFGFNPQQLDLKALRRIPEERISAVLGVPAVVAGLGAGLDRSTYANFAEAREAAYEGTVIPLQRLTGSVIRRQLLTDFERDINGWKLDYDLSQVRILQEDENAKVTRVNGMVVGGYLKVADAQRLVGVPVDETQDFYLRPLTAIEVPSGPARVEAMPELEEPDMELPKMVSPLQLKASPEDEQDGLRLGIFVKRLGPQERRFGSWLEGQFRQQERDTLAKLDGTKQLEVDPFDARAAEEALRKGSLPYLRAMLKAAGDDAALEVGSVFDVLNPRVTHWLGDRTARFGRGVSDTTAKAITEQLRQAHALGEAIPQVADRIKAVFADARGPRATMIARTEMVGASNRGALESYQQSGVVSQKRWLAALDERVRPAHAAAHGQTVALDATFHVGGEDVMAPGEGSAENAINCRCAIAPVLDMLAGKSAVRCPDCRTYLGVELKGKAWCRKCKELKEIA